MKVLITGVAGFLGSHLATRLLQDGNSVLGLDDLSTGSLHNLDPIIRNKNFSFENHDVREFFYSDVDAIVNLACPASPLHYQKDPVRTIETNFLGIINMLHLAKKRNIRILQASTSEVYGDPTISPQSETYWGNVNPIGPRSCYDEGKRAAETLCFDYQRQFDLDSRVVRIFNTYGPNMAIQDGRVVSNFIVQALKGENLSIFGDGSQTRSFCYVDDLINAIIKVLFYPNKISTPINIGNPEEFSILSLANLIIELTKSRSEITFKNLPQDDPKQRKPDIKRAVDMLDWRPIVSLDQGIWRTIEYFKRVDIGS